MNLEMPRWQQILGPEIKILVIVNFQTQSAIYLPKVLKATHLQSTKVWMHNLKELGVRTSFKIHLTCLGGGSRSNRMHLVSLVPKFTRTLIHYNRPIIIHPVGSILFSRPTQPNYHCVVYSWHCIG
jgi:hypothetical protein